MAKYKVKVSYKDLEKNEYLPAGTETEMTVKRANHVNKMLEPFGQILERIVEEKVEEIKET